MATERRRRYSTYGSVAYQPQYDGSAARQPARRETPQPQRRPRVQPRERVAARPSVEVREQGAVSLFAIVGFMAVAVCLYAVVWLVAIGGETNFAAHGPLLTGAIFGGAVLAGLPGRKKGKRQAGTRRAGERPRRATAHGRR